MAWQHPNGRLIYCIRYDLEADLSTELIVWLTPGGARDRARCGRGVRPADRLYKAR